MMKRFFLTLCALCATTFAWAATEVVNGITLTYSVSSGKATITNCNSNASGTLEIPTTLGGYPVTSIGGFAFDGCSGLTSVTIPSSVTSIGYYAFYNVAPSILTAAWLPNGMSKDNLKTVIISEGATSIPNSAFYNCKALTSVTIPSSVTSIGNGAFDSCSGLTSITIPSSVTSIGNGAFNRCSSLEIVVDEDNPNYTSQDGALLNKALTTLIRGPGSTAVYTIPPSVISIGYEAFCGCSGLSSVTIPSSVTSIGNDAFSGCSGLTSVTIPDSVTSIGDWAFEGCSGLTSVTIPDSVTSIGEFAFCDCSGLTSVTIPSSVTSIGLSAFMHCSGLTSVTILEGVTSIGSGAFMYCSALTSITIPSSVTSIWSCAFAGCSGLTSVTIPEGVTSIGDQAFDDCSSLEIVVDEDNPNYTSQDGALLNKALTTLIRGPGSTAVYTIPSSVTSIGDDAFWGCSGLTSVTIPSSVTSIGRSAFSGCSGLTSITIPSSVTSIGDCAFYNCSGLTSITIPSSVTSIGRSAFYGCSGLTSVTISEGVTSIGSSAFEDCSGLTSVTIPSSVTSIGDSAFEDCSGLTSVTIPDSVTLIGDSAFSRCSGLTSVTIPEGVTSIEGWAFYNCSSLTSVTISEGVTSIGEYAFRNCSGLTSVTIPSSVTSIGDDAFRDCSGLTSVTIPEGVTMIGERAFYGCSALTSLEFLGAPPSVGWSAFSDVSAFGLYLPEYASQWEAVINSSGKWNGITMYNLDWEGEDSPEYPLVGESEVVYLLDAGPTATEGWTQINKNGSYPAFLQADTTYGSVYVTTASAGNFFNSYGPPVQGFTEGAYVGLDGTTYTTVLEEMAATLGLDSIPESVYSDNLVNGGYSGHTATVSGLDPNKLYVMYYIGGATKDNQAVAGFTLKPGGYLGSPKVEYACTSGDSSAMTSYKRVPAEMPMRASRDSYLLVRVSYVQPTEGGTLQFALSGVRANICALAIAEIGEVEPEVFAFTYSVTSSGVEITGFTGPCPAELVIPATIEDLPVTAIGDSAFNSCSGLTSVTIPASVTSIGEDVFSECPDVMIEVAEANSVYTSQDGALFNKDMTILLRGPGATAAYTIPEGVTSIAKYAFYGCTALKTIEFPESLESLDLYAFRYCTSLESVELPDNAGLADDAVFEFCSSLRTVKLPENLTELPAWTFNGCSKLESITIPSGVTRINDHTFSGCSSLTSIEIPESVTWIGEYVFHGTGLSGDLVIPESVTWIGRDTFLACSGLTSVKLPSGLAEIETGLFNGCSGLTAITIPKGVKWIGWGAFRNCTRLTSIVIPPGVEDVLGYAFNGCSGLTAISIPESVTRIDGHAFSGVRPQVLTAVKFPNYGMSTERLTTVIIPEGTTSIPNNAFSSCTQLTSVEFLGLPPESVGSNAFPETVGGFQSEHLADWANVVDSEGQWNNLDFLNLLEFDITFDANGGEGGSSATLIFGSTLVAPTVTREGYTLTGWSPEVPSTVPAANTTYIAQWQINQYTATFDANGGLGGTSVTQDYASALVAPTVSREGHTFVGWSPEVPSFIPAANVVYIAQWQVNQYTATFDANGGAGGTSVTQDYGSPLTAPEVSREGYSFVGWSPELPATVPAANTTYTAQWQINQYTATFDANGGEGGTEVTQDYGSALVAPTVSREGYTFVEWSPEVPSTLPASNTTYTAQWQVNQYTITFDANGGEGGTSVTQDYGSAITAPEVSREGHIFLGWSPEVPSTVPAADVTYTAQWQDVSFLTYTIEGGVATITGLQAVYPAVLEIPAALGDAPVVTIAERAFAGCAELTSVLIPATVTSIGTCAFTECGSPVITVAEANPAYASADGVLFNKEMTTLISAPCVTDSYTLPESVTAIGPSAFENCTGIFTFPAAPIETVGEGAFPATQGTYRYEYATEWKAVIAESKWQNLTMSCVNPPTFTVTLTAIGGGEVSGGGEQTWDEPVTVTATADEGWIFCGWSTTPVVMTPEYTFTMPAEDVTLTACFAPKQAVEQYVEGNELITKDDIKEMAFDTPMVEVGSEYIEVSISLQTAETLNAWNPMLLEDFEVIADRENGVVRVRVPKGNTKAAFYKFVVPNEQVK